jgi:16S rRNA processing protein RimM
MIADRLLAIGMVAKTHGLRGHLKVIPFGETLATVGVGEVLMARLQDGTSRPLTTVEIHAHRRGFLFLSRELNTAEEAKAIVAAELCVSESRLPATAPGEFYWYQLIGLEVVSCEGKYLGRIEQIIETGSNDVYLVRQGGKEVLVPATDEVVREVDLEGGRMIVDLPETY